MTEAKSFMCPVGGGSLSWASPLVNSSDHDDRIAIIISAMTIALGFLTNFISVPNSVNARGVFRRPRTPQSKPALTNNWGVGREGYSPE
jgi:hypothetical protein